MSEPRPCRRNARTCRILVLIGKAASGARFAALHKGSIMALVVVGICDFGEALGRREASASSQPVVPGAGLFRAPGSLVSKIHSGGLRAVTATATNLHAQLRELNRLRDQVRKAKLSARKSRRVPQKRTRF